MTAGLLALAFSAGALAFAAPCAFPLLPGYVAFFVGANAADGREDGLANARNGSDAVADGGTGPGLRTAAGVAAVTGLGATLVFAAFAAIVAVLGASVTGYAGELELVVGVGVAAAGVAFLAGRGHGLVSVRLAERSRSPLGFFAFGATYGVAAAGCTAPVFVGVALAGVARGPLVGVAVVGAYAVGLVLALGVVTLVAALGHDGVVRRVGANAETITRAAGALLVVAGAAQVHYAITVANALG